MSILSELPEEPAPTAQQRQPPPPSPARPDSTTQRQHQPCRRHKAANSSKKRRGGKKWNRASKKRATSYLPLIRGGPGSCACLACAWPLPLWRLAARCWVLPLPRPQGFCSAFAFLHLCSWPLVGRASRSACLPYQYGLHACRC